MNNKNAVRPFGMRDKLGYLFGDFGNDFTFILSTMILTKFIYQKYKEDNNTDLIERYFDDHNVKAYGSLIKLHEWLYHNDSSLEEVKNMLNENTDYDFISRITGKTIEEIKKIENSMKG